MGKAEGSGRKQSVEWTMVNQTKNKNQVTCKNCNSIISAKIERIRSHMSKCKKFEANSSPMFSSDNDELSLNADTFISKRKSEDSILEAPNSDGLDVDVLQPSKPKRQRSMGEYAVKTSDHQKKILDQKISEFFYANNIAFNVADSYAFKEMITALRPGYVPPNRQKLAGQLLDEANNSVDLLMEDKLTNAATTLMLDGWSNTSNDSIIAVSIHTGKSTHLLDAIDCGSQKKTAEFCAEIAEKAISELKQRYDKNIFAVCCDNENKMKKFRDIITEKHPHILAFGCSAHYMNLVAKEITPKSLMKYVVEIQKFFRNHNRPHGWLIEKKGHKPQLPNETRWNSEEACLSSFIYNYQKYIEISIEHKDDIDTNILTFLDNKGLYRECVNLHAQLSFIAKALDKLQADSCTLAQTVEIWLDVMENKELSPYKDCIKKRFEEAVTPFHFVANITDPALQGKRLTRQQESAAEQFLQQLNPAFDIALKMYQIKDTDCYPASMFTESVVQSIEAKKWWKLMGCKSEKNDLLNTDFCKFLEDLHNITSTSASIERIFSTFGLVWSKLRNKLGCEKAKKLVKVYKYLKSKGVESEW